MDNIEEYANIVIYPDGLIEGNKITNYTCHMEYLIILANNSPRLRSVFEKYNIDLSINSDFSKEPTYSTDLILAKEGIIVLHNMVLDDETLKGFYITTPSSINDMQRQSLRKLLDGFDMQDGWLGCLKDDELEDVSFDSLEDMFGKIKK